MENSTKKWYQSKAIQGNIVSIIMMGLMIAKIDLDQGLVTEAITAIFALISVGYAVYGRLKATKVIK